MLQRRGRVDRPAADRVGLLVRTHESGVLTSGRERPIVALAS